ncbi:WD40/YVTN/BNR-like repeat-containing protein [Paenibacillus guangzhouensis]|uniref:WD40/YVTN/BNR-like repeat-containing protein n=1 Tax=Paenibacillus guangzhouensis TaxID=1473112 RepID=UPI0012668D1C|nr:hypothetical protein [Paenibacillus guangzhouensis]
MKEALQRGWFVFLMLCIIGLWIGNSRIFAASTLVEQRVTNNDLHSVAYNGEVYVAGASKGQVLVSKDLMQWKSVKLPQIDSYDSIQHVIWDGKQFVGHARDKMVISSNGLTWRVTSLEKDILKLKNGYGTPYLRDLFFDGQEVIGVVSMSEYGGGVQFITSTDGVNWGVSQKNASWLNAVASNGNRFVSLGGYSDYSGEMKVAGAFSTNKTHWQNTMQPGEDEYAYRSDAGWDILWDSHKFVAVGLNNLVYQSPDGQKWVKLGEIPVQPAQKDKTRFNSIVWNGQQYTAVGVVQKSWSKYYAITATSEDGVSWSVQELPYIETGLYQVIWANNQFVSVGDSGNVLVSEDGVSWASTYKELVLASEMSHEFTQMYWAGKYWVSTDAGHDDNQGGIYRSRDGSHWELAYSKFDAKGNRVGISSMIATTKGLFAVTTDGYFVKSTDGVGWVEQRITSNTQIDPNLLAWSGSKFIVLAVLRNDSDGSKQKMIQFSSATGSQWTDHPIASTLSNFYQVRYSGEMFYSYDYEKKIFSTSIDGVSWKQRLRTTKDIHAMLAVNKRFYLWGDDITYTSLDGVKWNKHVMPKGSWDIDNAIWEGSRFIGVQSSGPDSYRQYLAESKDGVHWTRLGEFAYSGAEFEMHMLFYKNDQYIYMDRFGGLFRSTVQ